MTLDLQSVVKTFNSKYTFLKSSLPVPMLGGGVEPQTIEQKKFKRGKGEAYNSKKTRGLSMVKKANFAHCG